MQKRPATHRAGSCIGQATEYSASARTGKPRTADRYVRIRPVRYRSFAPTRRNRDRRTAVAALQGLQSARSGPTAALILLALFVLYAFAAAGQAADPMLASNRSGKRGVARLERQPMIGGFTHPTNARFSRCTGRAGTDRARLRAFACAHVVSTTTRTAHRADWRRLAASARRNRE